MILVSEMIVEHTLSQLAEGSAPFKTQAPTQWSDYYLGYQATSLRKGLQGLLISWESNSGIAQAACEPLLTVHWIDHH